jgi:diguanylate cyclase (GGDEF)-like protein
MAEVPKILVADDEPHIRRILQFLLEQEGFSVILAENGKEALACLESNRPDLMLLDVMMPEMDGYAVLQHLRSNFETSRLPVIMLTAKGADNEKVRGLKGGANDYLTKPFNHEELLLRMRNMLEATRSQREANPLTGLPGNHAIERECENRLAAGDPFGFMYIDIDHFKAFNDYYGYTRGDDAITFTAAILRESSHQVGNNNDFIGHVGGDDFVVISDSAHAEDLARHIIETFDQKKEKLFNPEDFQKGYLRIRDRGGQEDDIPLITLTIALIVDAQGRFRHMAQLSDFAAELKRYGKTKGGSVVVKERRAPHEDPQCVTSGSAQPTS